MDVIIDKACEIDRAGENLANVREMGYQNVREMIPISAWYLWSEIRKLIHKELTQNATQISIGIISLTYNFVNASSSKASMKKGGLALSF